MPNLAAQVQVQGYSGDTSAVTFSWTLDVTGEYIDRQGWHPYDMPFTGSTTGTSASWSPDFGTIVGGWGKLVVSASLPGVLDGTVTSDPRWINMTGQNPGKAAVLSYIADNAPYPNTVSHIMCVESNHTFNQFNPAVNAGEPATPACRTRWTTRLHSGRCWRERQGQDRHRAARSGDLPVRELELETKRRHRDR